MSSAPCGCVMAAAVCPGGAWERPLGCGPMNCHVDAHSRAAFGARSRFRDTPKFLITDALPATGPGRPLAATPDTSSDSAVLRAVGR